MGDTLKVEDVRTYVREARAWHERGLALLATLEAKLEGSETLGQQMKRVSDAFGIAWRRRYGRDYVFVGAKDAQAVKRLLKSLSVDEVLARIPRYVTNDDPFYGKVSHSLSMFASTINQHGADQGELLEGGNAPAGCKHTPPCRSDVEHTRRSIAEMRQ